MGRLSSRRTEGSLIRRGLDARMRLEQQDQESERALAQAAGLRR